MVIRAASTPALHYAKPSPAQVTSMQFLPLRVEIRTLKGDALELDVDAQSTTVLQLKREVAKRWEQAPVCCQKLLLGTEEPADSAILSSLVGESASLHLMLVVSLEKAQQCLVNSKNRIRRDAVEAFGRIAPKGKRGALVTLLPLLADSCVDVRVSALKAFAKVAKLGDARATAEISERLQDNAPEVRCAAAESLVELAPGNADAIGRVSKLLADQDLNVIQIALKVLAQLAPAGGPSECTASVMNAVRAHLRHKRPEVRIAALKALVNGFSLDAVGFKEQVIKDVGMLLEDRESRVGQEAIWAFQQIIPNDVERIVAIAAARLKYGRAQVRLSALKTLAKEAPHGSDTALDALQTCLCDSDRGLRLAALATMAKLAPQGDARATDAIIACLRDPRPEIRIVALRLLPHIACANDAKALAATGALFSDSNEDVRYESVKAMRHIAQDDAECLVAASNVHEACWKADGSAAMLMKFNKPLASTNENPREVNGIWSVWSEKALLTPKNALPSQFPYKMTGVIGARDRVGQDTRSAARHAGSEEGVGANAAKNLTVPWPTDSAFLRNASRNPLFAAASLLLQGNDASRAS